MHAPTGMMLPVLNFHDKLVRGSTAIILSPPINTHPCQRHPYQSHDKAPARTHQP
jgi:hypothetical protein